MTSRDPQLQLNYVYRHPVSIAINGLRNIVYPEATQASYDNSYYPAPNATYTQAAVTIDTPIAATLSSGTTPTRSNSMYFSNGYKVEPSFAIYGASGSSYNSYSSWESQSKRKHLQKHPSNKDEFDGPCQFLPRPPPEYIAQQDRDLPHLPTNLVVHEQDSILKQVNNRLSRCAFDFVAKYQFPIPLANGELRPVERPEDRDWTEWVYLLKRLATKRRIPARVLYNGQIKQFITVLEGSCELRHSSVHTSRPLKDDRNVLQLVSAGIQVAKILCDAVAMKDLDILYIATEKRIQERSKGARYGVA